jgi:ornithine carbamoyltransferase
MCHSYINAAISFDFELAIACPPGHEPDAAILESGGERISLHQSALDAASGADLVVTDVWASMGQEEEQQQRIETFSQEEEQQQRIETFSSYQVNQEVMARANGEALFMHCLPAHRGEEVTSDVLDSPQSVIWQEAENRLHAQKALLEFLLATEA